MTELKLNEACKQQHDMVLRKGFDNFHIPTLLMLTVSELGEALEADRKNRHADYKKLYEEFPAFPITEFPKDVWEMHEFHESLEKYAEAFERNVKDTFEDEIADAFLRLMDLCGAYDIDIEKAINMKQIYNKTRPTKHGKAY